MRATVPAALSAALLLGASCSDAADLKATMKKIDANGVGETIGTVTISPGSGGTVFNVDVKGLPPGEHGFHVHEKGDCGPGPNPQGQPAPGMAAGGHWDPSGTKAHAGPQGQGHMGDLPALTVAADGTAKVSVTAPRLKSGDELKGKALMIHAGGDNYSDQPQPLGGGGGRIACGIIE